MAVTTCPACGNAVPPVGTPVCLICGSDLNSAPAATIIYQSIDLKADNTRTCSNEAIAGATTAQAGGVVRPTKKDFGLIAPSTSDRGIGFKVATAADVVVAGAKWRLVVLARPALNGV